MCFSTRSNPDLQVVSEHRRSIAAPYSSYNMTKYCASLKSVSHFSRRALLSLHTSDLQPLTQTFGKRRLISERINNEKGQRLHKSCIPVKLRPHCQAPLWIFKKTHCAGGSGQINRMMLFGRGANNTWTQKLVTWSCFCWVFLLFAPRFCRTSWNVKLLLRATETRSLQRAGVGVSHKDPPTKRSSYF